MAKTVPISMYFKAVNMVGSIRASYLKMVDGSLIATRSLQPMVLHLHLAGNTSGISESAA